MPRLLINPGTPQQWEAPLKPGINTVGRSAACDIQIDHGSVSGTHCEMTVDGDSVLIRDLGSTNGTFLNRAPVRQTTWVASQRLQLGGVEMELAPDAAARPAGPVAVPTAVRLAVARPAGAPSGIAPPAAPPAAPVAATSPPPPRAALRVAEHAPAPPPPPEPPPAYIADEYTAEAAAPAKCKYHPSSLARFLCPQCQLNYCELCVATRPGGTRSGKFCRRCSGECVPLNVQFVREHADKENFWATIPGMFAYPFQGSGATFLICGALFFSLMNFLGSISLYFRFTFLLQAFYTAYTFAYVQRVIQTAAQGSDEAAGWPDVSDWWQDIMVPCLQLLALALVCAGPAVGLLLFLGDSPSKLILVGAAGLCGAIYYPMAFLAMAMFDSAGAINPLVVIPAMIRIPLEYLTVLFLTLIILVVRGGQAYLMDLANIPILPTLVASFVALYFLTVQGRMLGLMYFTRRDRLGWFRTR